MSAPDPLHVARAPLPPTATRRVRLICLAALLCAVTYGVVQATRSLVLEHPDFEYFYKGGAWLLDHGSLDQGYDVQPDGTLEQRGGIEWYLPFVHRLMSALVWIGRGGEAFGLPAFQTSGAIWLTINVLALFASLRLLGRHVMGLPPQDWPVTLLVPFLLLQFFWAWEFRLNQINNLTLLLMIAAFIHWQQGRRSLAGFWTGLAALLKVSPALLVLWFLLKRQFRTVAVALITILAVGPLSDLIVFGAGGIRDVYASWAQSALVQTSHAGLISEQREMDWRNQSLSAVASRWLHRTDYATHFDNDPRIRFPDEPQYLNVVDLPRRIIVAIVLAIATASLAGLIWIARRPASACTLWQLRLEWALLLLAMLWLMPVLRRYHFIWMLPALAVLAGCVHHAGIKRGWSRLALAAAGVVLAAQVSIVTRPLLGTHIMEAGGVFLVALAVLAIPIVGMIVRLGRQPAALPADPFFKGHPAYSARLPQRPEPHTPSDPQAAPAHV